MRMNEEKVKELLRKKGLRVTSQRLLVLEIMVSHPGEHLTAKRFMIWQKKHARRSGLLPYTEPFRFSVTCKS